MRGVPEPSRHVLEGYEQVVVVRARDFHQAARFMGRERSVWLHAWTFEEDPRAATPRLVWRPDADVPLLEYLRTYGPEIRSLAGAHRITRVRLLRSSDGGVGPAADSAVALLIDVPDDGEPAGAEHFAGDVASTIGRPVAVTTAGSLAAEELAQAMGDAADVL